MLIVRHFVIISAFLLFTLSSGYAEEFLSENDTTTRVHWIQKALDDGAQNSKLWQYGWTGIYAAATTAEAINADDKDGDSDKEKEERFDSTVNATTSFLGFGSMLFDPLTTHSAAKKLLQMPETTHEQQTVKLKAAEKYLAAAAKRQKSGRSWQTHAIAGLVNILAGIAVANDDSREDDGLVMFATGMVVSEIQIFTMPTQAIEDLNNYKNNSLTRRRTQHTNRFFATVIPNGVCFKYLF